MERYTPRPGFFMEVEHPMGGASDGWSIRWVEHPMGGASDGWSIRWVEHPMGAGTTCCFPLGAPMDPPRRPMGGRIRHASGLS